MIELTKISIEIHTTRVQVKAELKPEGAISGVEAHCSLHHGGARSEPGEVLEAAITALRELATYLPNARFGDAPTVDGL